MKKIVILSILTLFIIMSINAAVIFQLNFDGPAAEDQATYVPGLGDVIPGGTVISTTAFTGWGGGWASFPPLAPSIITPLYTSQGGNALGVLMRTDNNEGYNVDLTGANQTTSSLTIEILVKANEVNNTTRNEYGMMTFIGNEAGGGSPVWSLRTLGIWGTPAGEVQLMTNEGGEVNLGTGAVPRIDYVEHWAVIMDRTLNKMILYREKSYVGEVTVSYGAEPFRVFSIGNYANFSGSSRSLIGYIDAVCIDNTILGVGTFNLPNSTEIYDWTLY